MSSRKVDWIEETLRLKEQVVRYKMMLDKRHAELEKQQQLISELRAKLESFKKDQKP